MHTLGKGIDYQRSAMNQRAIAACNTISEKMQLLIAHAAANYVVMYVVTGKVKLITATVDFAFNKL